MIGMLRGKVWEAATERLVLDVNGVGYILLVPYVLLNKARTGQELTLYTHLIPKEEEFLLFGFATLAEKQLFLAMLSVNGIGPKTALSILSTFTVEQVESAIAQENVNLLTKVPGLGKKTAQRAVLELKEKFRASSGVRLTAEPGAGGSEALDSMLALGFSLDEARWALAQVQEQGGEEEQGLSTEQQLKLALRFLSISKSH
ncbi:MAG: Holliday junction branch migration protein RuvA [Desulfitobacteriaceae bacterium]